MAGPDPERRTDTGGDRYQALLAVSEAIMSHRELSALFQGLARRLDHVVRFDALVLVLHDASDKYHVPARPGDDSTRRPSR